MASTPPPVPPPGYDPRAQRRYFRDQARAQRAAFKAQAYQMRYRMRAMRRSSVLGPLLLIAVGVVFLLIQTGRFTHDTFWAWYGHWWPMLLIGAGLIVLAEWMLDQFVLRHPERPAYRRSIGGGIIFLLLLFALAGVVASGVHGDSGYRWLVPGFQFDQDSMDEFFGADKHESDQAMDLAFPAGGSLSVVNPRGNITIDGTSDDNRIHLALHKAVYAHNDSDAETRAQQFVPAITPGGNGLSIRMPALDGARGDLILTVPPGTATSVTANRGDVHVASIKAPVSVTANRGDIDLSAITGAVTARINNGSSSLSAHDLDNGIDIQGRAQDVTLSAITGPVTLSGDIFGTTHLDRINGAIRFHTGRADFQLARLDGQAEIHRDSEISADRALGPVTISTHNGNVTLDRVAGDIWVADSNGSIDLTAAPTLGSITLEDHNGPVRVTMPQHASFSLQADTRNGTLDTDFGWPTNGAGNRRSVSGSTGAGGPLLRITNDNGDISVHKGDVEAIPSTPPAPPRITLAPATAPKTALAHKAAPAPTPAPSSN